MDMRGQGEERRGGKSNVRNDSLSTVEKYDVYLYRIFIHAREGNLI